MIYMNYSSEKIIRLIFNSINDKKHIQFKHAHKKLSHVNTAIKKLIY